jgi:serine protease Do
MTKNSLDSERRSIAQHKNIWTIALAPLGALGKRVASVASRVRGSPGHFRTKLVWLMSVVALSLLSGGMLQAQRGGNPAAADVFVSSDGDGQAWLGVQLEDVTANRARELKLPGEYGAVVTEVTEDSPAAKAGLKENDVVLEFAGERVRSAAELKRLIRETPAGRSVPVKLSHDGQTRTVNVTLEAHHWGFAGPQVYMPEIPRINLPDFHFGFGAPSLGVSADELTPQLAEYFGVKQGKGLLVRQVDSGTPAEKAGLKAGDCIVRVGSKEIGSVSDLQRALVDQTRDGADGKRQVELTIVRDRHELTVKADLGRRSRPLPPFEAEYLGPNPKELERLSAEIGALTAKAADQSLFYLGDDDDP